MIGIFFGSFDPPHIGHLSIVSECLNSGKISKVIVVPAYKNPWKKESSKYIFRYNLVGEAFKSYGDKVIVSQAELKLFSDSDRREKYYNPEDKEDKSGVPTYAVIRYLKEEYKEDEICIITTSETLCEISEWKSGGNILRENKFLIISPDHLGKRNFTLDKNMIEIKPESDIEISSTIIRNSIKEGKLMNEYLPGNTSKLISQLGLYKK